MRNPILTSLLRLSVYILCLSATLPATAQRNGLYHSARHSDRSVSFDVSAGAGYSRLGYDAVPAADLNASTAGDYGLNVHLGANYFFTTWFGIGAGADFSRYGQSLSLKDSRLQWSGVTDTDAGAAVYGERYDHTLHIHRWCERQQQLYIAPQVLLMSVVPFSHISMLVEAGVEYAFCVQSSYAASGDLEHTGYYPRWGLTLHDLPVHGFYRTTDFAPQGDLSDRFANRQQLSIVGKIGIAVPFTDHLDLRINALCKYAVYTSPNTGNIAGGQAHPGTDLGFHENMPAIAEGERDPHYFIPEYNTLLSSTLVSGHYAPLLIGLEIGIRYRIPIGNSLPCRCLQ